MKKLQVMFLMRNINFINYTPPQVIFIEYVIIYKKYLI